MLKNRCTISIMVAGLGIVERLDIISIALMPPLRVLMLKFILAHSNFSIASILERCSAQIYFSSL